MFLNQNSSSELKAQLTNAVVTSQLEISVTYRDNTDVYHPDAVVETNNTTAVTLLAAPSGGVINIVELIKVYNPDTQANTVQILLGNTVVFTCSIGAGESAILSKEGVSYDAANTNLSNITTTGKVNVANLAMPSNSYIDLTLGASGSSYTAPADGYLTISKGATAADQWLQLNNETNGIAVNTVSVGSGHVLRLFLPVKKDSLVYVDYSLGGTTHKYRFIYAEGSKP